MILELLYRIIFGPLNPRQPNQFFKLLIVFLRFDGIWPPDSKKKWVNTLYLIYSRWHRGFWLHLYVITQAVYFKDVTEISEATGSLFMLLTQISLCYKLEKFFINRYRIKKCIQRLNSDLFIPANEEEDKVISNLVLFELGLWIFYTAPVLVIWVSWGSLVFQPGFILPIKAWYPWESNKNPNYYFLFFFNYVGICLSAVWNVVMDYVSMCMFLHTRAQIEILGMRISKIGYNIESDKKNGKSKVTKAEEIPPAPIAIRKSDITLQFEDDSDIKEMKEKIKFMQQTKEGTEAELVKYIILHKKLLDFSYEIEDIFSGPIFCQLLFSSFIICVTMYILAEIPSFLEMAPLLSYLLSMITQIFLYCWGGNEVSDALTSLTQKIFLADFTKFNRASSKDIMIFMQRTLKNDKIKAGSLFKITLSLELFLDVMRSSYSYFAILRTMSGK